MQRTYPFLSRVRGLVFFVCAIMPLYEMLCITTHVSTYARLYSRDTSVYTNRLTEPHPGTRPPIRNARHGQRRCRTRYQLVGNPNSASKNETTRPKAVRRRVRTSLGLIFSQLTVLHSYWTLYFDASPRTLRSLNGIMRRDPRVLRWTVLKLADKLEDLARKGEQTGTVNHVEDVVD